MTQTQVPSAAPIRPVERFLSADESCRDIHFLLARARATEPVAEVEVPGSPGRPLVRQYYVFEHSLVRAVTGDPERFSNLAYAGEMRQLAGRTILELDPPEHTRIRGIVAPLFRHSVVARRHKTLIDRVLANLLDSFRDRGAAEILSELTLPFPLRVIAGVLGIPDSEFEFFATNVLPLTDASCEWGHVLVARDGLRAYFTELVATRRHHPGDDLISDLVQVDRGGNRLSDGEIVTFLMLLMPAGIETTYRAGSNLVFALLSHAGQWHSARADRGLIPAAIEEVLRWEPAVAGAMRLATRDTELGGKWIRTGSFVFASLLAANRDPRVYPDPDRFDIRRGGPSHVTFGHGVHTCVGMHLARVEVAALLNALLDRLPRLRLDPLFPDQFIGGKVNRSPNCLKVRWD